MKQVMKKLCMMLLLLASASLSWAADYELSRDTWFNSPQKVHPEGEAGQNVLKITLYQEGGGALAAAIDEIENSSAYDDCDIVYISTNAEGKKMNQDDVEALSRLKFKTIDLQNASLEVDGVEKAFTFSNSTAEYVILPDNWTNEEVRDCGSVIGTSLKSALSQGTHEEDGNPYVAAYVKVPGSLKSCLRHVTYDNKPNSKICDNGSYTVTKVRHIYLSGKPAAIDFCNSNEHILDANGHVVFDNPVADETTDTPHAAVGGGTRNPVGTSQYGPWVTYGQMITVDLGLAEIEEENCNDLVMGLTGLLGASSKEFVIPTTEKLLTLPADMLNISGVTIQHICIPGNIQYIRTRAFGQAPLDHIWTSGPDENTVYDNGYVNMAGETLYGQPAISAASDIFYGTITLPANLKLIESRAFANSNPHIKDVYVLAVKAPECHVDAFNTMIYRANNSLEGKVIDGIITRDAYAKQADAGLWCAMLHYPRECVTPDIQRYTDVTRQYSIATGLRDGKGGVIYFPNLSECTRAYNQGTTGYLWDAWDPTRDNYGGNSISYGGNDQKSTYDSAFQQLANTAYTTNTYNEEGYDKTDRVFYDTTDPESQTKPAGQKNYWDVEWENTKLYPLPTIKTMTDSDGNPVTTTVPVVDESGNYIYKIDNPNGSFIKIGSYTEDSNGRYVNELTATLNQESGNYVQKYTMEESDYDSQSTSTYFKPNYEYEANSNGSWIAVYTDYVEIEEQEAEWTTLTNMGWDERGNYIMSHKLYCKNGENYAILDQWRTNTNGKTTIYTAVGEPTYVLWNQDQHGGKWQYPTYDKVIDGYTPLTAVEAAEEAANGSTLYTRVFTEGIYQIYDPSLDSDLSRYDLSDYRLYDESKDGGKQRYACSESYVEKSTVLLDNQEQLDYNNFYSIKTTQEPITVSYNGDYRGWHQFVLTAYAANSKVPFVPYRSFISDNDWWTICLPFDLTRAELIKLFGTEGSSKLPYLSKLTYVVRDVENKDITLNFSKNLLEYKEELVGSSQLHGKVSETVGNVGDNDIVLHKGVPYLIRPFLTADAEGSIKRQFDILTTNTEGDLYDRITKSQELGGSEMNEIIYNGEYTVPAYVINNSATGGETVSSDDAVSFTMGDNTVFEYDNKSAKITYNGEEVDAQISSDYCYTFVGSFFLSLMPKYSYFLGWDSTKKRAAFWYNAVNNTQHWTWNNETGIILPNFVTAEQEIKITAAEDLENPARWVINLKNGDDFPKTASVKNHVTAMDFGGSAKLFDGDATVIIKVDNDVIDPSTIHFNSNKGVYSLSGQYMGKSTDGLKKGIYIVNGKKMVIK